MPDPYVPSGPPAGSDRPPQTLRVGAGLWIALGIVLALGALSYYGSNPTLEPVAVLLVIGLGVVFVVLAIRLRRGTGSARTWLTVLGAASCLALWPALLAVPAIVLQFRPSSSQWLTARRQPADIPGSPGPDRP